MSIGIQNPEKLLAKILLDEVDKMTNKQKLAKLCNIRTDLQDDGDHIAKINSKIQAVADDFTSLFKLASNSSAVKAKIEALKEPTQSADSSLLSAILYCQYEINRVSADIDAEANKKK